ncbi:alpha/beta hydrolase family esterase [Oxalicibacterium faecigallinarum]|uniref:Dienelactone hydrolase domain-containing protein n=1 Tax=Oxalicibacterium faecigallinarum TaxID=573741 RepID=A0A8J3F0Q7_9BURK|nr:PHB depolymerase family esterase [Oxalicibacterium faecigallinarum]GGI15766.1 hypothetical protein GCM10008066_00540 [Oxalicibacterium faecigallinarum]
MPIPARVLHIFSLSSLIIFAGTTFAADREQPRLVERLQAHAGTQDNQRQLISSDQQRSYQLLDASRHSSAPLIIVLHGGGGNGDSMIQRWRAKAMREGLIIAAPNGAGRTARMGTWNAGGCCGEAMSSHHEDVAFVADVVADVKRIAAVDPSRIYVTGMSNGGMLTHRVAIALSDQLAGAAVVAGAMFGDEPSPRSPVPILIMHGMADSIVAFEGGMSPKRLVARAQSKPFKPVQYSVEFWRRANGCGSAPAVVINDDVTVESNTSCRDNSSVFFYRLRSADHTWPGKTSMNTPALEQRPYDAIDATDVIWDFFKSNHRQTDVNKRNQR